MDEVLQLDTEGIDQDVVVGADGTIGRALCKRLAASGRRYIATSRRAIRDPKYRYLDLSDPRTFEVLPTKIGACYVLAGVTDMAACQKDPVSTGKVNVDATKQLASFVIARGGHVIVLSTNLVHSGIYPRAAISHELRPQNEYAAQKLRLESDLLSTNRATVLRITKVAESLNQIIKNWTNSLSEGRCITAYSNLVCAPVSADAVSNAMIRAAKDRILGVYQLSSSYDVSYVDIARYIATELRYDQRLINSETAEVSGRVTALPKYTSLDVSESNSILGFQSEDPWISISRVVERVSGQAISN